MLENILAVYLVLAGLAVMYLLAHRNRWGWVLSLLNQTVWLALAYVSNNWGFLLGAVAFGAVAVHGWFQWKPIPVPPPAEFFTPEFRAGAKAGYQDYLAGRVERYSDCL